MFCTKGFTYALDGNGEKFQTISELDVIATILEGYVVPHTFVGDGITVSVVLHEFLFDKRTFGLGGVFLYKCWLERGGSHEIMKNKLAIKLDVVKVDDGVAINGEDAAHTGIAIGTANVGKTIINNVTYENVTGNYNADHELYGRSVLGTTGSLTIDGVSK